MTGPVGSEAGYPGDPGGEGFAGIGRAAYHDLQRLAGAAVRGPASVNRALLRLPDTLERLVAGVETLVDELRETRSTLEGTAERIEAATAQLDELGTRLVRSGMSAAGPAAEITAELRRVNEEFTELVRLLPPVSNALRAMASWQERFGLGR